MLNYIIKTERGWPGHFCCASRCEFRRNTLLQLGNRRVVVSTVGIKRNRDDFVDTLGCNPKRYYETMAFEAEYTRRFWEANIDKQIRFKSPWYIDCTEKDDDANNMHDTVCNELSTKMLLGEI